MVSLQPNISDTPFNQRSPRPSEESVLNFHTQTDIWTLRLYDWIGPVGWFRENTIPDFYSSCWYSQRILVHVLVKKEYVWMDLNCHHSTSFVHLYQTTLFYQCTLSTVNIFDRALPRVDCTSWWIALGGKLWGGEGYGALKGQFFCVHRIWI